MVKRFGCKHNNAYKYEYEYEYVVMKRDNLPFERKHCAIVLYCVLILKLHKKITLLRK